MDVLDLDRLNGLHGTDFRLDGTYQGGEVGASRLVDGRGRRYVLKLQPAGRAPETTRVLCELGYPAPRYVACGTDYHVQEELPGVPAGDWGAASPVILARLLELNELQAGRAIDEGTSWPQPIVESVLTGFSDYAVIGTLERHSDESRELLRQCQRAVATHATVIREGRECRDIVHWDYTLANVLVVDDGVSGVIDWGGTRTGDRLFDLATFVYYARGEAPELERYIVERIGQEGLSVYLAHMAVRQVDWSLRHHGHDAGDGVVDYSLQFARRFP